MRRTGWPARVRCVHRTGKGREAVPWTDGGRAERAQPDEPRIVSRRMPAQGAPPPRKLKLRRDFDLVQEPGRLAAQQGRE
jgi:hypothetical protein